MTQQLHTLPVLTDRNEFGQLLESLHFHSGAEVGVQSGVFAEQTLRNWPSCTDYYLIDCWCHQERYLDAANVSDNEHLNYLAQAKERLKPFHDKLIFMKMFSSDAANLIPDGSLDYVFIDARHDYDSVMQDLECFLPKVRKGGIIAGHDFVNNEFVLGHGAEGDDWSVGPSARREDGKAVKSAVEDFVRRHQKQLIVCYEERPYPSWYFLK